MEWLVSESEGLSLDVDIGTLCLWLTRLDNSQHGWLRCSSTYQSPISPISLTHCMLVDTHGVKACEKLDGGLPEMTEHGLISSLVIFQHGR
jgi:hypothetical protein